MTTLAEKMAALPPGRQAAIRKRAADLLVEETSLRQLREAHAKTQDALARKLGIGQDGVSRLEQRSDMLISTLRDYVAALGGSIRLIVEFESRPPLELQNLGMLARRRPSGRRTLPKNLRTVDDTKADQRDDSVW